MLTIHFPEREEFDETTNTFIYCKAQTVQMEHSLVSISKWESKWNVPFLAKKDKTFEQTIDYFKCMTLTQNVDYKSYNYISAETLKEITDYINAPMTATTINNMNENKKNSREIVTSELIYYWMVSLQIPFECQKWHLNRLLTLIEVCNIKNAPPKKMSKNAIMNQNKSLNAARRSRLGSKG